MSSKDMPPDLENDRLRDGKSKVQGLNDRLLAVAARVLGITAESLEQLDELLENEFGPDVWKRIYESIPAESKDEHEREADDDEDLEGES